MSTYTQIFYHIVFSTKGRSRVITQTRREDLFRFMWGVLKNRECHLYRINGVEDHLHILCSLHPTMSLADLVKEIKTSTSKWVKAENAFPGFIQWQDGYGGFTHSLKEKQRLIEYIKNQEEHHRVISFGDELRALLIEAGIEFKEQYLC